MKKYSLHKEPSQPSAEQRRSINQRGFTLVELIIIMAIVVILATMAITSIADFKDLTKISRAAAEIRGLEKDIISYASEKVTFPADDDLAAVGRGGQRDPWGNPYVYKRTRIRTWSGDPINSDFDLYSYGKDKTSSNDTIVGPPNDDDIVRGGDGSFVGLAEKYGTLSL